jgi:DNA-binding transcriptional LysR family regulator
MTFDQFRYFLETSKFQHVGKAAKSLHISPSAVSTAIAALEDELGCKLFERKGQGIQLTEKGHALRVRIEKLLDQVSEIRLAMSEKELQLSGSYRVGASHFLATNYLTQAWMSVQKKHPALSIELSSMATAHVIENVLSGALDAGLCFSPYRHPDLRFFPLKEGELKVAARTGHPLFKKKRGDIFKALSEFPASIHKAIPGVDICEDHPMFEKFGITPKIHSLWDNDATAVEILEHSDSWSLLPDIVIKQYRTSIQALDMSSGWDAPFSIALIVRAHRSENPFLLLLRDELLKLL